MNISKEIYENNFDENIEFEPIADDRLDSTFTVIGENGEETDEEWSMIERALKSIINDLKHDE